MYIIHEYACMNGTERWVEVANLKGVGYEKDISHGQYGLHRIRTY